MHILWNNSKREGDDDDDLKSGTSTLYVDYNGKYYQLEKISIAPKPFQKPHPPIFIGTWGSSEAGLRRVQNMVMVGWRLLIILRQTSSEKNGIYFCHTEKD